jgi:hypothetical protein
VALDTEFRAKSNGYSTTSTVSELPIFNKTIGIRAPFVDARSELPSIVRDGLNKRYLNRELKRKLVKVVRIQRR